jgi:hypothetical protein
LSPIPLTGKRLITCRKLMFLFLFKSNLKKEKKIQNTFFYITGTLTVNKFFLFLYGILKTEICPSSRSDPDPIFEEVWSGSDICGGRTYDIRQYWKQSWLSKSVSDPHPKIRFSYFQFPEATTLGYKHIVFHKP